MVQKNSIAGRVFVGVTIGFSIGLLAFFLLPALGYSAVPSFLWGLWLLYILLGFFIGLVGRVTEHPIFGFTTHWWLRGAVFGLLFHLLLVLLALAEVEYVVSLPAFSFVTDIVGTSPYWLLVDGACVGIFMAWCATKIAGEGDLPLR